MAAPVDNVRLEECCKQTLKSIHNRQELGKLLRGVLAATPWIQIIAADPIEAAFTLITTDWEALANAIKAVGPIVKRSCLNDCVLEVTNHSDGSLGQFWNGMYEEFGG